MVDALVLGIDAAWTTRNASGIALVRKSGRQWTCVAVAPSVEGFVAVSHGLAVVWDKPAVASVLDGGVLLDAAMRLAGRAPDVVALDLPMSTQPITGRRAADDCISKTFGSRNCSAHSPNERRPGRVSDDVRTSFECRGFPLACAGAPAGRIPALIEVYPHTALLSLLRANNRVTYKVGKTKTYWDGTLATRRRLLLETWSRITSALSTTIASIALPVPSTGPLAALKPYEDAMDALICAWAGIEYLAGRTTPHGDGTGAIWT